MLAPLPLDELLTSWTVALKAQRKSPATVRTYTTSVRMFLRFLDEEGLPAELTKANVVGFMASLSEHASSSAHTRLGGIKHFASWLQAEEGFDATPIIAVKPPKLTQSNVAGVTEDELRRLIKACGGADIRDKRDKAMILLFAETGARASELLGMKVDDVDLSTCTAKVLGKGGKPRRVKFSASTAEAVDRYIRARKASGQPGKAGPLWIGREGKLTYSGLVYCLGIRAQIAGVKGFHAHKLRHSMAVKWLKAGGSEVALMGQAGWRSRTMIARYAAYASEELAASEFDRIHMGIGLD